MKGLTTKQRLFVEAYLASPNAVQAARKAGYKGNDRTLSVVGAENLAKPNIRELLEKRVESAAMSADEVLKELTDIGRADWKDFVEIKYGKDGEMIDATLRLGDKIKSLELIGKYHKLFTDKTEVTGKDDGPIQHKIVVEVLNDSPNKRNKNSNK